MTLALASTGFDHFWAYPFMRHALIAGIPIAMLSGLVGYFLVLRSQVFSGDALSHVAFTGALGALAVGIDARLGLFTATVVVGAILGLLGNRGRADDVVIGTVFTWVLGLGVLALSIYSSSTSAAANAGAGVRVLFGSVLGLSTRQAWTAALVCLALVALLLVIGRPLLFASIDPSIALARGVPVRALDVGFLALVGATAAEATQAVGALLLVGLLAAPAGAAQRLTSRPYVALGLSAAGSIFAMFLGLITSFVFPRTPPSFDILAIAAAMYVLTFLVPARDQFKSSY
jgi:zinc/manganese transport system permease protein